jgi:hypothetical protein
MFIIALPLFLLGMFALGISFSIEGFQALVFVAGILLVSLAMALPMHARAK